MRLNAAPVQKPSMRAKTCNKLLSWDQFGNQYQMTLAEGVVSLPTSMGAFMTIFLMIVLFCFTILKTYNMILRKDVNISSTINENVYSDSDVFDYSQGLYFAVAFTGYDNEREIMLDPSIGELEFYVEEWGKDEEGRV